MIKEHLGIIEQEIILESIDNDKVFEIVDIDVKRKKVKFIIPNNHKIYVNYQDLELTSRDSKKLIDSNSFGIVKGGKVSVVIAKEEQVEVPLSFHIDTYVLTRSGTQNVQSKYALIGHANFMLVSVLDLAKKVGKSLTFEEFKKDMNQMRLSELSSGFKKQVSLHYNSDMSIEEFKTMVYSLEVDCYEINKTSSCKSRGVKLKEKNISFTFNDVEGEDYEEEIKDLTKEQFKAEKSKFTKIVNENTAKPKEEVKEVHVEKKAPKEKKEEKWVCSRCGEENNMKTRFCYKCGEKRK